MESKNAATSGDAAFSEEVDQIDDRAAIVKTNLPFVDDDAAREIAADQLHPGKINPSSRAVDYQRSEQAQAEAPDTK